MGGWRTHHGLALALDQQNVDTDQIIPARFMITPRTEGYERFLFHDQRFDAEGAPLVDMPLNRHPEASILVSGRNFGTGSSREAAVYALVDFGIRVVVAPSFGDIFAANAVNNGLLPARVDSTDAALVALDAGTLPAQVDLDVKTVTLGDQVLPFELDETWRAKLINGWDDIDLTQSHGAEIATFRARRAEAAPWAFTTQTSRR